MGTSPEVELRPVGAGAATLRATVPLTAGPGAETLNGSLSTGNPMAALPALTDLVNRLRAEDASAADEFVQRYGPALRVAVRTRLTDPTLRRHFDSEDVCQSVLASFFARAACGQLEPDDPAGLLRLLVRMAVRKVGRRARNLRRLRRDCRRDLPDGDSVVRRTAGSEPPPDRAVAGRELLAAVRAGLGPDERQLAELRAAGMSWADVAGRAGGTPEGRRKQLRRALDDVLTHLGLEDAP